MSETFRIVQYWAGCPEVANSRWLRTLRLVRACRQKGWPTWLVLSRQPANSTLVTPFEESGCPIVIHPHAKRNFDPACVLRTWRWLRGIRCNVFHCHNVHTSPLIGAALAGVPVRIWSKLAMSPYYEQGVSPRGLHRIQFSTRVSCCLAHRVLAISEAVRLEVLGLGVSKNKIGVVRAPVEISPVSAGERAQTRRELGLDDSQVAVVSVGHAVPVKGWDILIRAFAQVAHRRSQVRLVLVGGTDGPSEAGFAERLRGMIAELGIAGVVQMAGQRSDATRILAAGDVFAFPSRSDGQGLALTEAMMTGLPCVAAAVGGIPEFIRDGRNGLLFEREDITGLARRLIRLVDDSSLRASLAAEGKRTGQNFTMQTYLDKVIGCYLTLLESKNISTEIDG